MRTYEQLYRAAIQRRAQLIREEADLVTATFGCTQAELNVILAQPPRMLYELNTARDRICGMLITITEES